MSDEKQKPNFFAVVPAPVLFHEELSDFSVRLFGVISTLCQAEGYCNAKNKTLGEWVGASTTKVSRAISELSKYGFITVDVQKNAAGTFRKIFLCISRTQGLGKSDKGGIADLPNGLGENDKGGIADLPIQKNNTSINNINTNKGAGFPKTKTTLFVEALDQVEFPESWPVKFRDFLKRFMRETHDSHPDKYYTPQSLKKTVKQVYNLFESGAELKYIAKLLDKCRLNGWLNVDPSYMKDEPMSQDTFNDGGIIRPKKIKIG